MIPGRNLDTLVAVKVTEWKDKVEFPDPHLRCPEYSTNINAAWQVVEKMIEKWFYVDLKKRPDNCECMILYFHGGFGGWGFASGANEKTMPHSVCLAALKACGVEINGYKHIPPNS